MNDEDTPTLAIISAQLGAILRAFSDMRDDLARQEDAIAGLRSGLDELSDDMTLLLASV